MKFPGLLIDESLNWKDHISRVKSKLSINVGIMYRCSKVLDRYSMYMLYSTLFLPYLLYCMEIWGNTYPTNLHCINMLQRRVIRLMHNAQRCDQTTPLFYKARILKFTDLVQFRILLFVYKTHKMNCRRISKGYLLSVIISTAHEDKISFHEPVHQLIEYIIMSLVVYGIKLWNSLNVCFSNIRSFHRFIVHYSKQLFESYGKQI